MGNLFQYTKTEGQGWLVGEKDKFKYDYPDPGKEMELGKDFRTETVMGGPEMVKLTGIPSRVANYTEDVAIPIPDNNETKK